MNFKIIVSFFVLSLMLFSCSNTKQSVSDGIDLANLDTTVNPANNFYLYANGGWLKSHPMPAEYSRYGTFDKLQEDNDKMVRDLVEAIASQKQEQGSVAQKIGAFFTSGMDTATINKDGIAPLQPLIDKIQAAKTIADIENLVVELHRKGMYPLFGFFGEADSKNSQMMIAQLYQGGLGMRQKDYYVETDAHAQEIRAEYQKYIARLFSLAGFGDKSENWAKDILGLETTMAQASKSMLELRDPEGNYHKMKLADVQSLTPDFNWNEYFTGVGLANPGDINVGQPDFFKEMNKLLTSAPMDTWKAYLTFNVLNRTAPYLSDDFVNANFDFFGKFLSGRKALQPRWRRVLATTSSIMGEALGQIYVEKYFPPEAKERMVKLVENLRYALGERIKGLPWMGDTTKEKALEKLAAIRVKIGYPDKWRDYSKLEVNQNDYVLNVLTGNEFDFNYEVSQINKPVDHQRWGMSPQTVNAYYNPSDNEICFPAGILQPPFFFMHGDDAVNYGAIGVVIGHEISHGFDDQGRKYDKTGNLSDWWTAEDSKRFDERTDILAKQYDAFMVSDSVHANGRLTMGENIADLGGLNISYTALQKALKENPAPEKIDGFTPDQRFFLAYAHVWAGQITQQEKLRRTKEDVHSLGEYRVLGPLPNMPQFYKAFNVQPGDSMYIPEDQRASIW